MPSWIQESFTDGHYRTVITDQDIVVYRVYGGKAKDSGGFATTEPAQNRMQSKIDSALLPEWKNTRQYEAAILIPKGTVLNIGKVAPQTIKESGTILDGNADQILLPQNWSEDWIIDRREVRP